jgi:hypothetical protein
MIVSGGHQQMSLVYNRILLILSSFGILSSFAFGASTLPIPKDSLCAQSNGVLALGNEASCSLQGFFLTLGAVVPHYIIAICISHVASIKYDSTVLQRYEPFVHMFAILPTIALAITQLAKDQYHSEQFFCFIEEKCRYSDPTCRSEWESDASQSPRTSLWALVYINSLVFFMLVVSMIWMTYLRKTDSSWMDSRITSQTSRLPKQSLWYLSSCFITYFFPLVYKSLEFAGESPDTALVNLLLMLIAFFTPLQGFWNFMIFIAPRYSTLKSCFPEESSSSLLKQIIFRHHEDRGFPTQLSSPVRRSAFRGESATPPFIHTGTNYVDGGDECHMHEIESLKIAANSTRYHASQDRKPIKSDSIVDCEMKIHSIKNEVGMCSVIETNDLQFQTGNDNNDSQEENERREHHIFEMQLSEIAANVTRYHASQERKSIQSDSIVDWEMKTFSIKKGRMCTSIVTNDLESNEKSDNQESLQGVLTGEETNHSDASSGNQIEMTCNITQNNNQTYSEISKDSSPSTELRHNLSNTAVLHSSQDTNTHSSVIDEILAIDNNLPSQTQRGKRRSFFGFNRINLDRRLRKDEPPHWSGSGVSSTESPLNMHLGATLSNHSKRRRSMLSLSSASSSLTRSTGDALPQRRGSFVARRNSFSVASRVERRRSLPTFSIHGDQPEKGSPQDTLQELLVSTFVN